MCVDTGSGCTPCASGDSCPAPGPPPGDARRGGPGSPPPPPPRLRATPGAAFHVERGGARRTPPRPRPAGRPAAGTSCAARTPCERSQERGTRQPIAWAPGRRRGGASVPCPCVPRQPPSGPAEPARAPPPETAGASGRATGGLPIGQAGAGTAPCEGPPRRDGIAPGAASRGRPSALRLVPVLSAGAARATPGSRTPVEAGGAARSLRPGPRPVAAARDATGCGAPVALSSAGRRSRAARSREGVDTAALRPRRVRPRPAPQPLAAARAIADPGQGPMRSAAPGDNPSPPTRRRGRARPDAGAPAARRGVESRRAPPHPRDGPRGRAELLSTSRPRVPPVRPGWPPALRPRRRFPSATTPTAGHGARPARLSATTRRSLGAGVRILASRTRARCTRARLCAGPRPPLRTLRARTRLACQTGDERATSPLSRRRVGKSSPVTPTIRNSARSCRRGTPHRASGRSRSASSTRWTPPLQGASARWRARRRSRHPGARRPRRTAASALPPGGPHATPPGPTRAASPSL